MNTPYFTPSASHATPYFTPRTDTPTPRRHERLFLHGGSEILSPPQLSPRRPSSRKLTRKQQKSCKKKCVNKCRSKLTRSQPKRSLTKYNLFVKNMMKKLQTLPLSPQDKMRKIAMEWNSQKGV